MDLLLWRLMFKVYNCINIFCVPLHHGFLITLDIFFLAGLFSFGLTSLFGLFHCIIIFRIRQEQDISPQECGYVLYFFFPQNLQSRSIKLGEGAFFERLINKCLFLKCASKKQCRELWFLFLFIVWYRFSYFIFILSIS